MSSAALQKWHTKRCLELDELEQAHRSIGGPRRGRRFATQQVNNAYLMLLSAQFQGYCRDLHAECVDYLLVDVNPTKLQTACERLALPNDLWTRAIPTWII
jgi:hypothetical protein